MTEEEQQDFDSLKERVQELEDKLSTNGHALVDLLWIVECLIPEDDFTSDKKLQEIINKVEF